MDVDSLRYALTLADELHFGRSAAKNFISEPQFGRKIRKLEAQVGTRIFHRTSRHVTVTAQGHEILSRARQILNAIDGLRYQMPNRGTSSEDVICVGVLGFGVGERWGLLRNTAITIGPGIEITHRPLSLENQYAAVLHREVDVALVHYLGEIDGIDQQLVMETPRVVVAPVNSPLTGKSEIHVAETTEYSWLRMTSSDDRFTDWIGPCASRRRGPAVTALESVPMAVATTGLLGLHGAVAQRFFPHPDVCFVPIDDMSPVSVALATRCDDDRMAIHAFRKAACILAGPGGDLLSPS